MAINNNLTDVVSNLNAMLVQDSISTAKCFNYFKEKKYAGGLDESSRKAMVSWLHQVQQTLQLNPDCVYRAMSIFDRYLCSGRGSSVRALKDKCTFQLAAITSFYTAVKIHEPIVLGLDSLLVIVRHAYTEDDFISMEQDILLAIDWRVSSHTAMDYARALLELIREDLSFTAMKNLINDCEKQMHADIADICYSCWTRSKLAVRCVTISLTKNESLSHSKKEFILKRLSESKHFCQSSSRQYLDRTSPIHDCASKYEEFITMTTASNQIAVESRSPVCVVNTAQQA
jgi:hypothetical protein